MTWTAPVHVSSGTASSDDFNSQVIDNLLYIKDRLDAAANPLGFGSYAENASGGTTSSSSYITLGSGPAVTVTTGTKALVIVSGTFNQLGILSYAVSGATTIAASDYTSIQNTGGLIGASRMSYLSTLNAGSNTFTVKCKSFSGSVIFGELQIAVLTVA